MFNITQIIVFLIVVLFIALIIYIKVYDAKRTLNQYMYEILIVLNENKLYTYERHEQWCNNVLRMSNNIIILQPSSNNWFSSTGYLQADKVIPQRILCTEKEILKVINITIKHYNQSILIVNKISNTVPLIIK